MRKERPLCAMEEEALPHDKKGLGACVDVDTQASCVLAYVPHQLSPGVGAGCMQGASPSGGPLCPECHGAARLRLRVALRIMSSLPHLEDEEPDTWCGRS